MNHKSILYTEKIQLLERLESNKQQIQEDLEALKSTFQPLEVIQRVVEDTSDTMYKQPTAMRLARNAVAHLPGNLGQSKWLRVAAQVALPFLMKKLMARLKK